MHLREGKRVHFICEDWRYRELGITLIIVRWREQPLAQTTAVEWLTLLRGTELKPIHVWIGHRDEPGVENIFPVVTEFGTVAVH